MRRASGVTPAPPSRRHRTLAHHPLIPRRHSSRCMGPVPTREERWPALQSGRGKLCSSTATKWPESRLAGFQDQPAPGARAAGRGAGGARAAGLAVARAGAQNQNRPIFNLVLCRTCRRPIQPRGPPQPVLDPAHAFAYARLGDQAGADVGDLASVHATTDGDIAVD